MRIRDYKKSDHKQILRLLAEFLIYKRETYGKEALEFDNHIDKKRERYIKSILKSFENKDSHFLVAEDDEKIIGYIIGKTALNEYKIKNKAGHIQSFYVMKKYRGTGVGKELYNSLIKWFKEKKCDHLDLDVYATNKKSVNIYKKWGFKPITIQMKKKL